MAEIRCHHPYRNGLGRCWQLLGRIVDGYLEIKCQRCRSIERIALDRLTVVAAASTGGN